MPAAWATKWAGWACAVAWGKSRCYLTFLLQLPCLDAVRGRASVEQLPRTRVFAQAVCWPGGQAQGAAAPASRGSAGASPFDDALACLLTLRFSPQAPACGTLLQHTALLCVHVGRLAWETMRVGWQDALVEGYLMGRHSAEDVRRLAAVAGEAELGLLGGWTISRPFAGRMASRIATACAICLRRP